MRQYLGGTPQHVCILTFVEQAADCVIDLLNYIQLVLEIRSGDVEDLAYLIQLKDQSASTSGIGRTILQETKTLRLSDREDLKY